MANKLKIATEFGNYEHLSNLILWIDEFPEWNDIVSIFVILISLETDPNPVAVRLQAECEIILEHLLEAFIDPSFCTSHTDLIIALMGQSDLSQYFYRIEFWRHIAQLCTNTNFLVNMEASRVMTELINPKNQFLKKTLIEFIDSNRSEIIVIFDLMINSE